MNEWVASGAVVFLAPMFRDTAARVRDAVVGAVAPRATASAVSQQDDESPPGPPSTRAAGPKPTLVLIHGLFSTPKEFALLSRSFQGRGIDVHLLEIPGYTADEQKAKPDWRAWVDAASAALDARYGPDEPIVLGGLCVGGAVAAAVAARPGATNIAGLAMLSATFRYDGWGIRGWYRWRSIAYLLGVDRWISIAEREPFGIKDPKTRAWVVEEMAHRDPAAIGPDRLSLRGIRESEKLYRWVRARLPRLRMPMLVLHAKDDEIASLASVADAIARVGAPCRLVVLDDSYHMITIDHDRKRVAHELADFVDRMAVLPRSGIGRRVAIAA